MIAQNQQQQETEDVELYVTNSDAWWDDNGHIGVRFYGHTPDGEQDYVEVEGLRPEMYVNAGEFEWKKEQVTTHSKVIGWDEGHESLFGDDLVRIQFRSVGPRSEVAEIFEKTYEADVWYTNFARTELGVETGLRAPSRRCHYSEIEPVEMGGEYSPRTLTIDIETDDRGEFPDAAEPDSRILSIAAHDSQTDETVGFLDLHGRSLEESFDLEREPEGIEDLGMDFLDEVKARPTEKQMLLEFSCWLDSVDPDLIVAWNVDFDAPYLAARMRRVGVNPDRMARHDGQVKLNYFKDGIDRWGGRSVYDLLDAYKDTKRTELQSYTLDSVALEELGEQKIDHTGVGFYELYMEDTRTFFEYNAKDTMLAVQIDQQAGVLDFKNALREEVGCDFEMTSENNEFIEMFTRQKLHEKGVHGPTKQYQGGEDYEGGHVFDPANGLYENVVGIDVKSLYPMTMRMFNMSPETKLGANPPPGFPANKAPNGIYFSQGEDGIFKELVDDAIDLKEGYRTLKNEAGERGDRKMVKAWGERYAVAKTITNSIYGVLGWEHFFLYDREVAEAITLAGQACIKRTALYVETETVGEVIYGDTDSNYVKLPDDWTQDECVLWMKETCEILTDHVYADYANTAFGVPIEDCEWLIEPEAYLKRFLQTGKKKRYAYLKFWDEGEDIRENPEMEIVGYGSKRSDFSKLTQDAQQETIEAILGGKPEAAIGEIARTAAEEITPTMDDWERIGIASGLGKKINPDCENIGTGVNCDDCFTWSSKGDHPQDAHPRAAWNSNHLLGTNYGEGSKPMRVYVQSHYADAMERDINVIAFESNEQIQAYDGDLHVNAERMTTAAVIKPLGRVLQAIDMDVEAAIKGQLQSGLGSFL